jgi:hypothetical protein
MEVNDGPELSDKGGVVIAATNNNNGKAVVDKDEVVIAANNNNDGTAVVDEAEVVRAATNNNFGTAVMDEGEVVAIPDVSKGDALGATDTDGILKDSAGELEEDAVLLIDAAAKLLRQSSVDKILEEADAFINTVFDDGKNASVPPVDGDFLADVDGNASILDEVIDTNQVELMVKIDPVVLVYSFVDGALIMGASKGLVLSEDYMKSSLSRVSQLQQSNVDPNAHL